MDKIESDYRAAKTAYDEAERALAVARHALRLAEDARNSGWKELVAAAARITDDSLGRKLAAGARRDEDRIEDRVLINRGLAKRHVDPLTGVGMITVTDAGRKLHDTAFPPAHRGDAA